MPCLFNLIFKEWMLKMTNKELLNFRFVDRVNETKLANNFLEQTNNVKILLVRGHDLVGKNHFVNNLISKNSQFTFIDIDFRDLNYTSAYKFFVEELERISNGKFIQYIRDHYTDIIEMTSKSVSTVLKIKGDSFAADILNCMMNTSLFFLNNHKEQESSINIITKYIKEISKHENLIVVFKNFSNCDEYSLPIIYQTISSSIEKANVKYIVTINENDWQKNKNEVFSFFSYRVPVFPIEIKQFEDANLFSEMLFDIFDLTYEDQNSIQHIFNVCNGYPGELKRLLSRVYFNNMDLFFSDPGEAKWDAETINKVICNEYIKIEFKNPLIKLIFLIVLFLDINLTYEMIVSIVTFISNKLHILLPEKSLIAESIQELLYSYHLLEIRYDSKEYLTIVDSQKKDLLRSEFEKDNIIPLLSRYISDFLLYEKENVISNSSKEQYFSQLALHTYISKHNDWIEINYKFAKELYENYEIPIAQKVFLRLENVWDEFNNNKKFLIASCFYDAGKYEHADKILNSIEINSCDYEQLILIAKISSINMRKENAISVLDYMLAEQRFKKYRNSILDIKQRILSNIKSARKDAKKIFDCLETGFINKKHNYKNFLLSSMEYYRGERVQQNFKILEDEYKKTNNQLMLAELLVNQGFDLFWQGKIDDAKKKFKESISNLELLRIHEISYSLNNYANCQMMEGDFEGAILSLRRAQMFNESKYTEIVLKTHLMVCYAITDNKTFYKLFNELKCFLNENNNLDISVYLKVYYALGFVQDFTGDKSLFSDDTNYLKMAISLADIYEYEVLPYIWFKDWKAEVEKDISKRLDKDKYFFFKTYRFEPWLLTITHD